MPVGASADEHRIAPEVWKVAIAVVIGAMAVVFDTTILSVAISDLTRELRAPLSTIQWVTTGYLLALSVTIPITGWAQSVLGGKRLWLLALGLFLVGSIASACAWSATSLIAFRVVQGVGGGIMMALTSTLIMQAGGGRNVGKLMSVITVPTALGPVLGPVLGGVILHLGNWRWLFAINIPFCLVGAWLAIRNLPADAPSTPRQPLDTVGLLLLPPGVAAVIYSLSRVGGNNGFSSAQVLAPLALGVLLIVGFVGWALHRQASALVDIRLLRRPALGSSSVSLLLTGGALYGTMLLLPLYFIEVRGENALGAGLLLIPQGIGTLLSRSLAGGYMDKIGPRAVAVVALVLACAATIPFAFATADTSYALLTGVLLVRGIGLGAAMVPLSGAGFVGMSRDEMPHASILVRLSQQFGGSFGVAILAVILERAAAGAHTPHALAVGFQHAFWWSIAFTAIAVPVCLLLPGRPPPPARPATAVSTRAPESALG